MKQQQRRQLECITINTSSQFTTLSPSRFSIAIGGSALILRLCVHPACSPVRIRTLEPSLSHSLSLSNNTFILRPFASGFGFISLSNCFLQQLLRHFRFCRRCVVSSRSRKVSQMCEPRADTPRIC